jgi:hypothetical protein
LPSKNDHTGKSLSAISDSTQQVWALTKNLTQKGLKQEQDKKIDPFNEFMQSEEKQASDGEDSESEIDLLPCL